MAQRKSPSYPEWPVDRSVYSLFCGPDSDHNTHGISPTNQESKGTALSIGDSEENYLAFAWDDFNSHSQQLNFLCCLELRYQFRFIWAHHAVSFFFSLNVCISFPLSIFLSFPLLSLTPSLLLSLSFSPAPLPLVLPQ